MSDQDRVLDELDGLYERCFKLIDLLPFIDELDYEDAAAMAEFKMIVTELTLTQARIETRLEGLLRKAEANHLLLN